MPYYYAIQIDRDLTGDLETFALRTKYARNFDDIVEEMLVSNILQDEKEQELIKGIAEITAEEYLTFAERFESAVDA